MATEVVRIDATLVEAARTSGEAMSRSVAAQLSHWARLGRAVENADLSTSAIHAVLARQAEFDSLEPEEQQAVATLWDERIANDIGQLDLATEFEESGEAYAELDDDGNLSVTTARTEPPDILR